MISWQVRQTICGLEELGTHRGETITHLLSILDPEAPEPAMFGFDPPRERLTLRFHDIILPHPDYVLPSRADMEKVLAFGRTVQEGDPAHMLIHCHMGISRSTAAATALLLQAHPDLDDDQALAEIASLRPQAWPNSLMTRHADALLGRGGRLLAALGRLYRRQLEANPRFAEPLRTGGRLAEVEMAEEAGD
ncbi:MAG TPA: hypothetical protein VGB54_03320 [Allosphingosinicella sp.]|jgi:predicted protein tyrosine phosphatase